MKTKRDFLKYLGFHTAVSNLLIMHEKVEPADPKLIDLIAKGRTAFHEGVSSPLGNFILGIHFAFKDLSAPASPVEEKREGVACEYCYDPINPDSIQFVSGRKLCDPCLTAYDNKSGHCSLDCSIGGRCDESC